MRCVSNRVRVMYEELCGLSHARSVSKFQAVAIEMRAGWLPVEVTIWIRSNVFARVNRIGYRSMEKRITLVCSAMRTAARRGKQHIAMMEPYRANTACACRKLDDTALCASVSSCSLSVRILLQLIANLKSENDRLSAELQERTAELENRVSDLTGVLAAREEELETAQENLASAQVRP